MTVTNSATFAGSNEDQLNSLFRQYQIERNRRACLTAAVEDQRISQIDPQAKPVADVERPVSSEIDSDLSDEECAVNELFRDYQETREEDHSDAIANIMAQVDSLIDAKAASAREHTTSPATSSSPSLLSRVFNAPSAALDSMGSWLSGGTNRWLVPAGATAAALVAFVTVTNVQQETPPWQQVADGVSVPGFSEFIKVAPDDVLDSGASLAFNNLGMSASHDAGKQAFVGGKAIATFAGSLHTDDKSQIEAVLGSMRDVYSLPKADTVLAAAAQLQGTTEPDSEKVNNLMLAMTSHHNAQKTTSVFELGVWTIVARQAIDAKLAGVDDVPLDTIFGSLPSITDRITASEQINADKKSVLTKAKLPADTSDVDQLRELRSTIDSIDAVFAM